VTAEQFSKLLSELQACGEATKWAKGKSFSTVWETCERGDWLLWLCGRMADRPGWPTHKEVVLAACDCAETALQYVKSGEDRPRKCIATVRAWVACTATIEDVRSAMRAARAANDAAAAADAAYAAARAANDAAAAADAAYAAARASYAAADDDDDDDDDADAAYAYAAARASYTVAAADRTKMLATCADIVRKRLKVTPKEILSGGEGEN
jgi:hypothetical protein